MRLERMNVGWILGVINFAVQSLHHRSPFLPHTNSSPPLRAQHNTKTSVCRTDGFYSSHTASLYENYSS